MNNQSLRATVMRLAQEFADEVFETLRSMSLDDILALSNAGSAPSKPRSLAPGRSARVAPSSRASANGANGRRTPADMQALVDRIVALLRTHKEGLRAEQIREQLGIDRKELPKPIGLALAQKKIAKEGEKRATTYFAR